MNRKSLSLLSIAVIIFISLLYLLLPNNKTKTVDTREKVNKALDTEKQNKDSALPVASEKITYAKCQDLQEKVHKVRAEYHRTTEYDWDRFLEDGYSVNEVTRAIHGIQNINFAFRWRKKYYAQNSAFAEKMKRWNSKFELALESSGIPEERKDDFLPPNPVPTKDIRKLIGSKENYSDIEQLEYIPDDVAYLMTKKSIDNNLIISLLEGLNDYNQVIGFEERGPSHLIDYAALYGRYDVFEYLRSNGATPSNEPYLGNSLEWTLKGLYLNRNNNSVASYKKILDELAPYQLPVSAYRNKHTANLQHHSPNLHFSFSPSQIKSLAEQEVDLSSIKTNSSIFTEHTQLNDRLQSEEYEYLGQKLGISDLEDKSEKCRKKTNKIRKITQKRSSNSIINTAKSRFPNNEQALLDYLSNIDPTLANCYIREKNSINQLVETPNSRKAEELIDNGDYYGAIEIYNELELSPEEKNNLFWYLVRYKVETLPILLQNNYLAEGFKFEKFIRFGHSTSINSINKLEQMGIKTRTIDTNKQSMLYTAINRHNYELARSLIKQGYDFAGQPYGDPIHKVLGNIDMSKDKLIELLALLMPINKGIDKHHLSRMKEINIKYPKLYDEIVKKYPDLSINNKIKPPISTCN